MAMKMKVKSNLDCPVVICDHCGFEIVDGANGRGHYLWRRALESECEDGDVVDVFFVHRDCHRPWEAAHPKPDGTLHLWMPLTVLPTYLAANVGVDIVAAQEDVALWSGI